MKLGRDESLSKRAELQGVTFGGGNVIILTWGKAGSFQSSEGGEEAEEEYNKENEKELE